MGYFRKGFQPFLGPKERERMSLCESTSIELFFFVK